MLALSCNLDSTIANFFNYSPCCWLYPTVLYHTMHTLWRRGWLQGFVSREIKSSCTVGPSLCIIDSWCPKVGTTATLQGNNPVPSGVKIPHYLHSKLLNNKILLVHIWRLCVCGNAQMPLFILIDVLLSPSVVVNLCLWSVPLLLILNVVIFSMVSENNTQLNY